MSKDKVEKCEHVKLTKSSKIITKLSLSLLLEKD